MLSLFVPSECSEIYLASSTCAFRRACFVVTLWCSGWEACNLKRQQRECSNETLVVLSLSPFQVSYSFPLFRVFALLYDEALWRSALCCACFGWRILWHAHTLDRHFRQVEIVTQAFVVYLWNYLACINLRGFDRRVPHVCLLFCNYLRHRRE